MTMPYSLFIINFLYQITLIPSVSSLCFDINEFTTQDKYLQNNLLGVTTTVSLIDCAAACQSYQQCQSFGFEPENKTCHLHGRSSDSEPTNLILMTTWTHGNVDAWPKTLLGTCATDSCPSEQTCHVNKLTGDQICLTSSPSLPDYLCPIPLDATNAVLSTGGQEIGTSRTYTCNDEYLDTGSFLTSAVSTCLPDNTWSSVDLTCSGPYIRREMETEYSYIFHNIETDTLQRLTGSTSSLKFFVKTCRDCNFLLHTDLDYNIGTKYEVVLGGWGDTQSVVSRGISSTQMDINGEGDILSCTEFKPFWLSWANGVISAGKGNILGDQVLLSWIIDTPMDVNFVSYSSHTPNPGVWYFLVDSGI